MKILQLTNKPPWPPRDGGAIAILNLSTGLSRSGNQLTVLAMNTSKHHVNPADIPDHIRQTADFRYVEVPAVTNPVCALTNLLFSGEPYTAVRFVSDHYRNELITILKGSSFDIIQLEGTYLCPYIPVIRRFSDALISLRAHNIESEIWERSAYAAKGLKKWYFGNLSRRVHKLEQKWMNSYDILVPITSRDGDQFQAAGNTKPVMVIPGGIDFSFPGKSSPEEDSFSLFHIGSLDWMPNQEGLLWFIDNCWEKIRLMFPELTFRIAGRNAPEWLVNRLKHPGILYCGEVEDAETFIRSNGIMVVPLFSGSGMRIKIIEGMARGKAIVTTSTGAEGLEITDHENIMIANEPADFIRKTEQLLRGPLLRKEMGDKALHFARTHFDHVTLAKKLADFYLQNIVK